MLLVALCVVLALVLVVLVRDVVAEVRETLARKKDRRIITNLAIWEAWHKEQDLLQAEVKKKATLKEACDKAWGHPRFMEMTPEELADIIMDEMGYSKYFDPFESMDDEEVIADNLVRDDWEPSYVMADFPWEQAYEDMLQEDVWKWSEISKPWSRFFWDQHAWYIDMIQIHDEVMVGLVRLEMAEIAREAELEFLKVDLKKRQFGKVPKQRRTKDMNISVFAKSLATTDGSPIEKARRKARRSRNRSETKQALRRYCA